MVLAILVAVLLVLVTYWFVARYRWMSIFRRQGVPGPSPNVFLGDMAAFQTSDGANLLPAFQKWRKKYGKTFSICFGGTPCYVTHDLGALHEIFIKNFDTFRNRNLQVLTSGILKHNLLGLKDDKWKRVRSILSPSFSTAKLKLMSDTMMKRINQLINEMAKLATTKGEADVYQLYQRLTLDVISETAFAMHTNSITNYEAAKPLLNSLANIFRSGFSSVLTFIFPGASPLLVKIFPGGFLSGNDENTVKIEKYCRKVIKERREKNVRAVDALQFMLDAKDEATSKFLTDEEVLANAYTFLLAGYETTSTALTFITYLLALHQEEQETLYQEIKSKVKDQKLLDFDMVRKLPYLECVWSEGLRVYPPVSGFLGRVAEEDTKLGGINVPKDSWVLCSPMCVHHDPEYWPDPLAFKPERWSEENKHKIKPFSFIPFGEGPRQCIGKRFSEIEAKLALTKIVLNFKLEATPETPKHPMKVIQNGPTIYPAGGAVNIKMIPRE